MTGLPEMVYSDGIRKYQTTVFGGYNHTLAAGDGEIYDMQNMTSEFAPLLSPRRRRYLLRTLTKPNGLYARDGLFWVDGTGFYQDGEKKGDVADSRKLFAGIGKYIIILPDKVAYDRDSQTIVPMEKSWTGSAKLQDGTYSGEAAKANTIYAAGANWAAIFNKGDAVEISGATVHPENNKTIIIREIDGDNLRFYENSFVIGDGGDQEAALTVARKMPDLDFICENENRLWGCKGDTIYASKLGDPFNWNVFDGVATDSYAVEVGSAGDFTGCVSYLGYPCFFKDQAIYKVYGDRPSNYQVMSSASLGTAPGNERSFAIAGEILFYLSRVGIVSYSGGIPQSIAAPFGTQRFTEAVAGSDGVNYFVSMKDMDKTWGLYVFDTGKNMWEKEDQLQVLDFGWDTELYFLAADGKLWMNGNARTVPGGAQLEPAVESFVEFGDFVEGNPNVKGTSKLQIRMELGEGASVTISMLFDSVGQWEEVATLTTAKKRSYYLPIIPRRSDHFRIKITGTGDWKIYSIVRENYSGSELL